MCTPSNHQRLLAAVGRLTGLTYTTRYEMEDGLREELEEIYKQIESALDAKQISIEVWDN